MLLSDDTSRLKKDQRILSCHYIHAEICPEGTKHTEGKSKLMDKFDKQLNTLHLMYNELEFYLEACESGSMFENLLEDELSIFATTAANPHESSFAYYYNSTLGMNLYFI